MMLDYNSLLTALAVSATCLAITLLGSWFARRTETFLLACAIGLTLIVSAIISYGLYVDNPIKSLAILSFVLVFPGFAMVWGAGYQFRTGHLPVVPAAAFAVVAMVASITPMALGYDGFAFIIDNIAIATFMLATGYQYWQARVEAPVPLTGITVLYSVTAVSFLLCAGVPDL